MKKIVYTLGVCVTLLNLVACSCDSDKSNNKVESEDSITDIDVDIDYNDPETAIWDDYDMGKINFHDKAPGTKGSEIYHAIIPEPEKYIRRVAKTVLNTLYFSPEDQITPVYTLDYSIEDTEGISAKGGGNGHITIFYSTRHVEKSYAGSDVAKVLFETRGVLLHELTHAFQLEPQGIGDYGSSKDFWAFIEGMADAVRIANGGFNDDYERPEGGNYSDGYRTTGYFLVWLKENKDKDFLRKFNRTALEVIPWSWDGAAAQIFGEGTKMSDLWKEYQLAQAKNK